MCYSAVDDIELREVPLAVCCELKSGTDSIARPQICLIISYCCFESYYSAPTILAMLDQ